MAARCLLEIDVDGRWQPCAAIEVADTTASVRTPTKLEYEFDYLDGMAEVLGVSDFRAVSCRHPVSYEETRLAMWPAFLLDIIPSGAGRRWWEAKLGVPNSPRWDWEILVRGGFNPVGNVRVQPEAGQFPLEEHDGFPREEVLERGAQFIEYAHERGAWVAGGSGAGGDAPKLLLREDEGGMLHADGALDDRRTRGAWFVKFPRSSREVDRMILRAEAAYHRVASRLGVRSGPAPTWSSDALFMPRFDRIVDEGARRVLRLGVESLYSLAGVTDWGVSVPKERFAAAIATSATDVPTELREFLLRDVLDVAMGNTDNHGRNTAMLKTPDGRVELTPLFDFAPMVLDPQGIARVCRWKKEDGGFPDYAYVADALAELGLESRSTRTWLADLGERLASLPVMMREEEVPSKVIDTLERRIARVARSLGDLS